MAPPPPELDDDAATELDDDAATTASPAAPLAVPPAPAHVSEYAYPPVLVGVTERVPLVLSEPLHAESAMQLAVFVEDHVTVAL